MKGQPNRLGIEPPHHLDGSAIDRTRPLQFRLDGRLIAGFAGDTILSALLASGIDTVGRREGAALALSSRHAPTVAALAARPQHALPIERTPATDGADYVTTAHRLGSNPIARLLQRSGRSLNLDLDRNDALARPWLGDPAQAGPGADLVVVGGGIAGMAAALAAAKRGLRVILAEAEPLLGGKARLFGTQEGEERPDEAIARLTLAVAATDAITVLTGAEAFALRPGVVRLHQVELLDGKPTSRVIDIRAPQIVLATGSLERLPVFPGNRLPGVTGALEAFQMAQLYGVWPGRSTLIATSSSPAYRIAMLATDAGITVPRIIDSRPHPQSRFIEFSRAYGITQAAGTIIASATPAPRERGLTVAPQLALSGYVRPEAAIAVDRLVVCGGWQPDLTLWHMAGGQSAWNGAATRLEARGGLPGIALAGSAAGWFSSGACMDSGTDAVDALLGHERKPVDDRLIDPIYETPDGPAPIGEAPEEAGPAAYLDSGWRHIERPRRLASSPWPAWLPFAPKTPGWSLAATPRPLDIAEIAAGVQLAAIPAASAGIVAQERVAMVVIDSDAADPANGETGPLPLPPSYLTGRYDGAALWVIAPDEARLVDIGTLIHADPDETDPLKAIGVVVRIVEGKPIALVSGGAGQAACLSEPDRAIGIRLIEPYNPGA